MVAICDDERLYTDVISKCLYKTCREHNEECKIVTCKNGKELIEVFKKEKFDAVFLDIDMPVMSGFECAKKLQEIKKNVIIIFVTNYDDMVYQSWDYQPFWFVRKSHLQDLEVVLPRLFVKIQTERENENPYFNISCENKIIEININEVKYIASYKHDVIIHYRNKSTTQTRCKISEIEKQLSPIYFIRIQNGIVVNSRFISKITSRDVILLDGESIHIGREKVEHVKNEFQKYIRSR